MILRLRHVVGDIPGHRRRGGRRPRVARHASPNRALVAFAAATQVAILRPGNHRPLPRLAVTGVARCPRPIRGCRRSCCAHPFPASERTRLVSRVGAPEGANAAAECLPRLSQPPSSRLPPLLHSPGPWCPCRSAGRRECGGGMPAAPVAAARFAACAAYMDSSRFGKRSLHLTIKDLAAVLYPACCADPISAGPDGICWGRPHLLRVLEGQAARQACFPTVRPISPSCSLQPAQPWL